MRWPLLLVAVLLAGCAASESATPPDGPMHEGDVAASDGSADIVGVGTFAGLEAATAAAIDWAPEAELGLVSFFEGDIPAWSQDIITGGNRWTDAFRGAGGPLGDGLSEVWAYSFHKGGDVHDASVTACQETDGWARFSLPALVVITDAAGDVVRTFEASDDDEGAPLVQTLPGTLVDAETAWGRIRQDPEVEAFLERTVWTRNFLAALPDGAPVWLVVMHTQDDDRFVAAADGHTGARVALPATWGC